MRYDATMTNRERIKRAIYIMRNGTPKSMAPLNYHNTMMRGRYIIRDNWPLRESVITYDMIGEILNDPTIDN